MSRLLLGRQAFDPPPEPSVEDEKITLVLEVNLTTGEVVGRVVEPQTV